MLVLRQEAVADLGMAIFGQSLEAEVAHPVAGVILIETPCGVPDPLVGVGEGEIQHIGVGLDKLRVGGAGQKGAHPVRTQGNEKKAFGEELHDKKPPVCVFAQCSTAGRGSQTLDLRPGGYYNKAVKG